MTSMLLWLVMILEMVHEEERWTMPVELGAGSVVLPRILESVRHTGSSMC